MSRTTRTYKRRTITGPVVLTIQRQSGETKESHPDFASASAAARAAQAADPTLSYYISSDS